MRPAAPPRHFSMIREFHLADFFTGNAACGMAAVFCAMTYVGSPSLGHFFGAAALVLAGLIFDVLDGRVARWRHNHSALGRELDSLRTSSHSASLPRRSDSPPGCAEAGTGRR